MEAKDKSILLVEDDEIDVETVQRAFETNRVANPLRVVHNGAEALAYLRREGEFAAREDVEQPAIVLLDLNMPVMNGIEFLREVKSDDELKKIPIVVLTTSREETDLVESYRLGAAGYIVKPVDFEKFLDAMKVFNLYWSLSELPS
jgi:CheY-like chemotaxis protein